MAVDPSPPRAADAGPLEEAPPHDVLAAEEFALPVPDPVLHPQRPVELPPDPTGIPQPHDILAAEEFPIPAVPPRPPGRRHRGRGRAVAEN